MAYLGNSPARSFISFERQVFTIVNFQTVYTLDHSVTNENDIRLVVNNIVQEPGSGKAYTATGTTLTLSAALVNGTDEMYCVFLGRATATNAPGAGSVGTAQIADDAVTNAKVNASAAIDYSKLNLTGNIALADLSATGTKDATTFLRGDNTFAEAGGGKVLQVVQGSTSTETRSSSNTLIDTTLSASITPSSSSSKVLVTVFQNGCDKSAANSGNQMVLKLLRGASVITTFGNNVTYTNSAISNSIGTVGTMYLDSPATTSATTYKTQFSNGNNTANVGVQGTGGETSIITLMEISA
jgi:hypothetical protein